MPALDKATKKPGRQAADATVDPAEVERFAAIAAEWWDPAGKFRPLHRMNPVRLEFIRDRICARFGRDPKAARPLAGVTLIDIGAGGGLIAEPLARLGAAVTAIDASERNVAVARLHAEGQGLAIDYRFATAGDVAGAGESFDVVLSLEVIEHVADRAAFLADCAALVRPGGLMILATLNRTAKSFALGIVGAEYILRWLPIGTHDWRRFVRPSELAADLRHAGLRIAEFKGIAYNPLADRFSLGSDIDVNYMAVAERA
ncbi:MAG: bifunctional 2-polyprenyl-6-hydroxyphenol methylase/3-demethylubiquinol 3-O-methyltransferase UbiG [Alphaproteobacteria bacterium]|nr:bifunctional 2-polyprenyl-6-hydroxyphenol methylase/3-demethylubiquinol 3-O-methyltransferase UbiG [Alphaproteobacteria bacterium]